MCVGVTAVYTANSGWALFNKPLLWDSGILRARKLWMKAEAKLIKFNKIKMWLVTQHEVKMTENKPYLWLPVRFVFACAPFVVNIWPSHTWGLYLIFHISPCWPQISLSQRSVSKISERGKANTPRDKWDLGLHSLTLSSSGEVCYLGLFHVIFSLMLRLLVIAISSYPIWPFERCCSARAQQWNVHFLQKLSNNKCWKI